MKELKFDDLPNEIANLRNEVKEMKALFLQKAETQPKPNIPLGIKNVSDLTGYTVATIYGYCQRREIPYHKKGNRLYFFKSDIIDWIKTGKQKTIKELQVDADELLSKNKKGLEL